MKTKPEDLEKKQPTMDSNIIENNTIEFLNYSQEIDQEHYQFKEEEELD